MGPRAPSPVPQRISRRARPSKQARTSGPGESSSSRPQPSPVTSTTEATLSPQFSPSSRIRRPLFVGHPIPGNVALHSRDFHQESCYDVDSCHGRVSGINKICIHSSSYCRSQATAAKRSRVEHRDGFSSYK